MKKYFKALLILTAVLVLAFSATAYAADEPYLVDDVGVLSEEYVEEVGAWAKEVSDRLDFDIAVWVTDSLGESTLISGADKYYEDGGFGQGSDRDGCVLILNLNDNYRAWYISTAGYGITAINDSAIDSIGDSMYEYLDYLDYESAIETYISCTANMVDQARNGHVYGEKELFSLFRLVVAVIIGIVLSVVITGSWKSEMKSVAIAKEATNCVSPGSMNVNVSSDRFLYHTVTRTRRAEHHDGGHIGGGTHTSSGGMTHGGGGGRF